MNKSGRLLKRETKINKLEEEGIVKPKATWDYNSLVLGILGKCLSASFFEADVGYITVFVHEEQRLRTENASSRKVLIT